MNRDEARGIAEGWIADSKGGTSKHPVWAGSNYIVDHNDGSVYHFSVWADAFKIAFDHLYRQGDDDYELYYHVAVAHRNVNTIHRPRDSGASVDSIRAAK